MLFNSREHAGQLLAKELERRNIKPDLVYGLARGGVVVLPDRHGGQERARAGRDGAGDCRGAAVAGEPRGGRGFGRLTALRLGLARPRAPCYLQAPRPGSSVGRARD